jgi:protein-S-isoprenylcysteine O-methyltransferase Ste14
MATPTTTLSGDVRASLPRGTMLQAVAVIVLFFAIMCGVLFGAAGTFDVPAFWSYVTVMLVASVVGFALVLRHSPDLVQERLHPGPGERDRASVPILTIAMLTQWLLAGADVGRWHLSDTVPRGAMVVGLIGVALGLVVSLWATVVNRFFSSAVRLQPERGQHVVTTGPYRYVRHPGYLGGLLFLLASGVALGSWVSVAPMLLAAIALVWRTDLEDRMLRQSLPGYEDYARRVRYRLVRGIW